MKCVILAAGEGKRVHPLTYTRPKVMLPIANKPILEWNLINAIDAGIKDFLFVAGYKSEMIRDYFGNGQRWDINIEYVNQGKPMGTAHAIGVVEKFVKEFIVLSGDTFFGKQDIANISKKKNSMGLIKLENAQEYGVVETKDNKIQYIHEKMEKPITNIVNAGIYHFNSKIFDFIKKTKKSPRGEYEITDSINMMIQNTDVHTVSIEGWRDIVYPWHMLEANEELLKNNKKTKIQGTIEKNTTIKGNVIVGKNTIIMNGSYIEGPVTIGNNCKIGPNCYIRPYTSIADECHIGNACEIKNSIIMNNSNVPHQNYVGDSIIGENCNLGAGTKIANLRFDKKNIYMYINGKKIDTKRKKLGVIMGDNTQTGINSMINIGTTIGNNVLIAPGASVKGEIRSNSEIY